MTFTNPGHSGRAFLAAKEQGRAALVGYLPVGYPDVPTSLNALKALCTDGDSPGVDLVEIGLPYSDPMLDGPVIQRAGTTALRRGVRTRDVFAAVEAVASTVAVVFSVDVGDLSGVRVEPVKRISGARVASEL